MTKYLDYEGLRHFWGKIKKWVSEYVYITYDEDNNNNIVSKTVHVGDKTLTVNKWALESTPPNLDDISEGTTNKHFTATDKSKLSGILAGAEVNQNAFSNVKVGSSTIAADTKTDTLELVAGSNVTLTPNATNDKVTISVSTGAIPDGSSTTPKMDGTAAVGTETTWAHGDHVHPTDTSRAPKNHASSDTTYGKGTTSNYGHVKLSDSISSTSAAASGGIAATPKAVNDVKNLIPTISYDSTNNKIISTVNGTSTDIVTAETLASAADRIFWATFGTTTATELVDAVTSNKIVLLKAGENDATYDNKNIFYLNHYEYINQGSLAGAFVFSQVIGDGSHYIVYQSDSNGWQWSTIQSLRFETRNNKSSSISGTETSSSTNYPTNYAVKTYVDSVLTNGYIPLSLKGQANGVCPLDSHTKIDPLYLPSYVDDVVEVYGDVTKEPMSADSFLVKTGEGGTDYMTIDEENNGIRQKGVIYIMVGVHLRPGEHATYTQAWSEISENSEFRWGGTQYVRIYDSGVTAISNTEINTVTNDTSIPVS